MKKAIKAYIDSLCPSSSQPESETHTFNVNECIVRPSDCELLDFNFAGQFVELLLKSWR